MPGNAPPNVPPAEPCLPDESAPVPARSDYGQWTTIELPGTSCYDGSPYRFFVNHSATSNDVLVMFEAGASCWDYEGCSQCGLSTFCASAKLKGTSNTAGIDSGHITSATSYYAITTPLPGAQNAFSSWNKVYIPYCTGDMQMGSRSAEYVGGDGSQRLAFKHVGHQNTLAVAAWIDSNFPSVPRLSVLGVSSGGTAALVNYHALRSRIRGAQCGYLFNDSGPLFSGTGRSGPLHQALRAAYDLEPVITVIGADLGAEAAASLRADLGSWPGVLARAYPRDRFATLLFQSDLNYLFFAYDSVSTGVPYPDLAAAWQSDLAALRSEHDAKPNLAYYMPYFRPDNCSHTLLTLPISQIDKLLTGQATVWYGTEIAEDGSSVPSFIEALLDNTRSIERHFEQSHADGAFAEDAILSCRAQGVPMALPGSSDP